MRTTDYKINPVSINRLRYCPETGVITRTFGNGKITTPGYVAHNGYLLVPVGTKGAHLAHRLAWFLATGSWPNGEIDHINGNRTDNRLENLRVVDRSTNAHNKHSVRSDNKSTGVTGVSLHKKTGRYKSEIEYQGVRYYLGSFDTVEDAAGAYRNAKQQFLSGVAS